MRSLLWFAVLFLPLCSVAQPYGNEWIDYGQKYFAVEVVDEGIYRMDYAQLQRREKRPKSKFGRVLSL